MVASGDGLIVRLGYGQYYPADEEACYLLYDGPQEWGLRVAHGGDVALGEAVVVDGEYSCYTLSLPSGMQSIISGKTMVSGPGSWSLRLADSVRDLLSQDPNRS